MDRQTDLRVWFGLKRQPFAPIPKPEDLFLRPCMEKIREDIEFAVGNSLFYTVIGDVGAGKSTVMRYSLASLPEKRYTVLPLIGGNWSFVELLRQCMACMGIFTRTTQQSTMLRSIYEGYAAIRDDGKTPVIFIDEANLFQQDVFNQLHLLSQQELRDGRVTPIVMCGQDSLFDRLRSPFSKPLLSRILNGHNLCGMEQDETSHYVAHHIQNLAGGGDDIFGETSLIAIHQSAGGIPRRINELCLLSMRAAMEAGQHSVSAENVRQANKAWWEK
jgi:general secretion pathway protein A